MTIITLTFDNGPDPEVTPLVLATLRRHGIKSTFFVLGERMRDRRGLAERAHAEGHWIGNHTYNHMIPLGAATSKGLAADEIARTQALIADLSHERRFFRPFGGGGLLDDRLLNREALEHLQQNQFTCVLWNVIAEDWAYPKDWVRRALARSFSQDHALVVLHDLATGAMDALDHFISEAKEQGAVFQQDFPKSCVPIEQGRITGPVERYLANHQQQDPLKLEGPGQ